MAFRRSAKTDRAPRRSPRSEVIFETGYGPSGLPHLGTFGEVARTSMVRHAFRVLTRDSVKTRLIAFSDDMDGLMVPDNIPNREIIAAHLGKPLTKIPDPFGEHESFAAHNNARLRAFLDRFGFDYEFMSSTEAYQSGRFDNALMRVLERFDEVQAIMLPSLREERAATYSPFLPIYPRTGIVMQARSWGTIRAPGQSAGAIPTPEEEFVTSVTGGKCKLQWKPDWAMRWHALGVDYEMAGKDLIDLVNLSSRIARALGSEPPAGFNYELFLDENGQKISNRRAMGSRSTNGWPMRARRACRCSCSRSRRRQSGSISTSSRATSTTISPFSTPIHARSGRSGSQSGLAHPCRNASRAGNPDP